ncbi:MAG: hypothetical protein ABW162_08525 [Candidatus Sedimenticola sp. PURPLELP]
MTTKRRRLKKDHYWLNPGLIKCREVPYPKEIFLAAYEAYWNMKRQDSQIGDTSAT